MRQRSPWIILLLIAFVVVFWYFFENGMILERRADQTPQKAKSIDQTMTLKFGHDMPEDSAQHKAALRYAKIVNYKTQGRIKIDVYPDQLLGTDQDMIEMAREGQLAIILPPTAKMTTLVPELQVLDLPFYFQIVRVHTRFWTVNPGRRC